MRVGAVFRWGAPGSMGEEEGLVPWEQPWYLETTPARANDLLLLYAGIDVYRALVAVGGWSHQDLGRWTQATLAYQLFGIERG